jgi:hypothetical protein
MERLDAYRIRKYIRRRVCRVYVASVRIIFYAIYAPYYIVYTIVVGIQSTDIVK